MIAPFPHDPEHLLYGMPSGQWSFGDAEMIM